MITGKKLLHHSFWILKYFLCSGLTINVVQCAASWSTPKDSTSNSILKYTRARNPLYVKYATELLDRRPIWWDIIQNIFGPAVDEIFFSRWNMLRHIGRSRGQCRIISMESNQELSSSNNNMQQIPIAVITKISVLLINTQPVYILDNQIQSCPVLYHELSVIFTLCFVLFSFIYLFWQNLC